MIINADDFGYTRGVNRAIAECAAAGTVTSATLMAKAAAFADAATLAQSHPQLGVGCHVVLVDGEPVTAAAELPSLCEGGAFKNSIHELARAAVFGAVSAEEVQREAAAQFRTLREAGIHLTHFDTHKHAHMFPAIFTPLLETAREAGIPAVRNPFEPFSIHWITSPGLWLRGAQTSSLRHFRAPFCKAVEQAGMRTTDGTVGIAVTGVLDLTWLRRIVQALPEGTWELVCHPGYVDEELQQRSTRLTDSREVERAALTSTEIRRLLAEEKIELISYAEL